MKIWFLTDEFPPNYGGGIGMYVDMVSRGFAEAGHDITVITADEKARVETITEHLRYVRFCRPTGAEKERLGYFTTLLKAYYQQTLQSIEQLGVPDAIELPEYNAIGYYLLQAKHLGKKQLQHIKLIVHCHTPSFELMRINRSPEYAFPIYWIGQMERYCLSAADALLTQSTFLHDRLVAYTGEKRFEVIPLPYRIHSSQLPYQCGKHFLYAGRLEYRKGVWQLVRQMAKLWEQGDQTPLMLVGGDVYFEPTGKTIGTMIQEKYGHWIENGLLTLHDKVPPAELERLMSQARAVIVPSIYENYPYINIMAMANHVPVIVSRQGGQAEAVEQDGINGFIFDWDKPDDCLLTLQRVIALDEQTLRTIGENGYRRICACCDVTSNISRREAFYQEILEQPDHITPYPFLSPQIQNALPREIEESQEIPGMLSVVIPYYNLGNTVEETILSVLHSDCDRQMLEIILLDDGSMEPASIAKAEEMAQKYPLHLERIPNGGLANARNTGIHLAHGEYVCFLDADDTVQPSYFTRCLEVLKLQENVSYVYSWVQYFEGSQDIWVTFDTSFPYFCAQNQLTCMAVVRRKDYLAFGLNHREMEYGLEDYDGWLGLAENGRLGVCIPEPLVNYRVRQASMARSMSLKAIMYLRSRLRNFHPALYQRYGDELYLLVMQNGSNICWNNPLSYSATALQNGSLPEIAVLQAELNAIKRRRGYRVMDKLATTLYRNRVIHALRFRLLPKLRRNYRQSN